MPPWEELDLEIFGADNLRWMSSESGKFTDACVWVAEEDPQTTTKLLMIIYFGETSQQVLGRVSNEAEADRARQRLRGLLLANVTDFEQQIGQVIREYRQTRWWELPLVLLTLGSLLTAVAWCLHSGIELFLRGIPFLGAPF